MGRTSLSSAAANRPNFSEEEPLFRTKIVLEDISELSRGPLPLAHFREVLAIFGDIKFGTLHRFGEALRRFACDVVKARHAADDIQRQAKAVHAIEDDHVERRGSGALFDVPADVDVVVIVAPIRQAMDQRWITVEREDDRLILGEEMIEVVVGKSVWMFAGGLQRHEVHDVHDTDAQVGKLFAKE